MQGHLKKLICYVDKLFRMYKSCRLHGPLNVMFSCLNPIMTSQAYEIYGEETVCVSFTILLVKHLGRGCSGVQGENVSSAVTLQVISISGRSCRFYGVGHVAIGALNTCYTVNLIDGLTVARAAIGGDCFLGI